MILDTKRVYSGSSLWCETPKQPSTCIITESEAQRAQNFTMDEVSKNSLYVVLDAVSETEVTTTQEGESTFIAFSRSERREGETVLGEAKYLGNRLTESNHDLQELPFHELSDDDLSLVYSSDYYSNHTRFVENICADSLVCFPIEVQLDIRMCWMAYYLLIDPMRDVYLCHLSLVVLYIQAGVEDVVDAFFELASVYPHKTSYTVVHFDQFGNHFMNRDMGYLVLDLPCAQFDDVVSQFESWFLQLPEFVRLSRVFIDVLLSRIFQVRSALNGNNGEATNSDDHVRVRPAHRYQRPVNGGRNDPNDHRERQAGVNRANAGRRVAEQARQAAAQDQRKEKVVFCTDDKLGWDGVQFYRKLVGQPRCIGLKTGDFLRASDVPGELFTFVFKSDVGYLERYIVDQPDKELKTTCILTPWDDLIAEGGFEWEGHNFSRMQYTVFLPALAFLRKKFSTNVISETLTNGMLAGLNREFGLDIDLVPTVQYYVHKAHHTNWLLARDFVTRTKPIVRDRIEESYSSSLNLERSEKQVVIFRSQDCLVPDAYFGRTDCCITLNGNKWSGMNPDQFDPNNADSYPKFATAAPDANNEKYYRSVYMRFDGNDVPPFVTYSVNARNACKSLKRMAGARESQAYDHYLSSLQYACYGEILSRCYDVRDYLSEHQSFFSVGRAAVETRMNPELGAVVITKFEVGPENWQVSDDVLNHKLGYVTPFAVRPSSFHSKPTCGGGEAQLLDIFQAGGFYYLMDYVQTDRPRLRDWMDKTLYGDLACYTGSALELNAIYQFMSDSFQVLRDKHNFSTVGQYAETHPNWLYLDGFLNYLTMLDCESDRCWHASIKHVKKVLRKMYVEEQYVHLPTDVMVKTVNAKVKKEFAKFGKVPRLFVTYDAGCMFANELPEYSKVCLDGSYDLRYRDLTANVVIFAKPSGAKLKDELTNCINSMRMRNHLNVLIYSDDSVWSGNINGVDFAFNVDISSCDSGNKLGTFGLVYDLLRNFRQDYAVGLMSQCAQTINLVNPEDKDECMRIQMATFFEGSGTVLTTILNHVAMYMIGSAAVSLIGLRMSSIRDWVDIRKLIMEAGVLFGHVLTVDACLDEANFCPEKIQFLKRSPLRTVKGDYVPCLNYGTIFRGFGSLEGDLVSDMVGLSVEEFKCMSLAERWDLFASRVVAGLVNEPDSVILRALRTRFSLAPKNHDSWSEVTFANERLQHGGIIEAEVDDNGKDVIDDLSLACRYGCTVYDLEVLASQIMNSEFGDVYPSEAVSAFAETDYGVKRNF